MTRGLRQIVRFNWPFYAAASVTIVVAVVVVSRLPLSVARVALYAATGMTAIWIYVSTVFAAALWTTLG